MRAGAVEARLWDWAVATYRRPGVAEACLALQDQHGQNVPLLLWALWSRAQGRGADFASGGELARRWEEEAVGPLRRLRRALKTLAPDLIADPDREAVRDQVKTVELDAERRLLAALARLPAPQGEAPSPGAVLTAASQAYGRPLPSETFEGLLHALNAPAA